MAKRKKKEEVLDEGLDGVVDGVQEDDIQGEAVDVREVDLEVETQAEEEPEVQDGITDNKQPELSKETKLKDTGSSKEETLDGGSEVPIDEVPIKDLPGFEKGSRLDPLNPHDVSYARQQLKRQRASKNS